MCTWAMLRSVRCTYQSHTLHLNIASVPLHSAETLNIHQHS